MLRQGSKVFSLLVVLALLAACGVNTTPQGGSTSSTAPSPSGSTASSTAAGSASASASSSTAASTAAGGGGVTVRWRTRPSDAAEQAVYQELADSATQALQAQGITVQYAPGVNDPTYHTKIKTELAAGNAPDIFWVGAVETADFVNTGKILDIKPFVDGEGFDLNAFYPQTIQELTREGKVYGLPRDISTMVVYYNENLFKEAGLPTPKELSAQGNWTFETMLESARKLTDPAKQQYGAGWGNWWGPSWGWFVNAAGGSAFNEDRTACALNTPEAIEGARFAQQFYTDKLRPAGDDSEVENLFNTGKVAMLWSGRWTTPGLRTNATSFTFDVAEMPQGAEKSTWLFWGPYLVNADTANPEAAWAALKQITSAESMAKVAELGTNIPARKDQAAVDVFLKSTPPTNNQAFLAGAEYAVAEAPVWEGNWADFSSAVQPLWDQMIQGQITPEAFGQQACEQTEETFN